VSSEAASPEALDDALLFLRRYFKFPDDETAWTHALFAAYTWRYEMFMHAPRLVVDSPEGGSGKSTLAKKLTGGLCRELVYSEDTTAAGIYQDFPLAGETGGNVPQSPSMS
jgi:hypothetical protein